MRLFKNMRFWVITSFVLFSISFLTGWTLWDRQSDQWRHYMLGRTAYVTTLYNLASDYFDQSFADYQTARGEHETALKAALDNPASLELAELSQHFKALALVKMGNFKLAVVTFKEALALTDELALSHESLTPDQIKKVQADRKVTQVDFEILFHKEEQLAKKEGKGGDKGDQEEKTSEDPSKGNQAGKGDRDQL
jgi:tetratricopeptide (TPR) repeat protein